MGLGSLQVRIKVRGWPRIKAPLVCLPFEHTTQEVLVTHRNSPSLRRILFPFYTSIFYALIFHLSKSRKYLTKVLALFGNMLNVFKMQWKIRWFMLPQREHKQRGVSSVSLVSQSRLLRKLLDPEGFS